MREVGSGLVLLARRLGTCPSTGETAWEKLTQSQSPSSLLKTNLGRALMRCELAGARGSAGGFHKEPAGFDPLSPVKKLFLLSAPKIPRRTNQSELLMEFEKKE